MSHGCRRVLARALIVFALLWVAAPPPARADKLTDAAVAVFVGGAAALALIGVGVYFAVRQPRVSGCVVSSPDGKLTLQGANAGDPLYLLQGETGDLPAGKRVKVVGRKTKDPQQQKLLVVSRLAKIYGACAPPSGAHAFNTKPANVLSGMPGRLPQLSSMQLAVSP